MRPERVLIVDDNAINRKLFSVVLSKNGFDVATASDASEAIARINESKPDLILMDIQLPRTDGLALTRRLKSESVTRDIIIIAATSYAMRGDKEKALAAGCDGYLTKPIDTRSIAEIIRSHLTGK